MPGFASPFDAWLLRVADDPIHADGSEAGLNAEAQANLWRFGFLDEELGGASEDDVVRFLRAVEDEREWGSLERFGRERPMVLYAWVDEMAGELRLSLVSASHGRLPFGASLEIVDDPAVIARGYLESRHDGIPFEEFRPYVPEKPPSDAEPPPFVLRVWVSTLPRGGG